MVVLTADQETPAMSSSPPPAQRRNAVFASVVCALALVAAVVSFAWGNWLGIVWVLLAGVSSNMAWYYLRKDRMRA